MLASIPPGAPKSGRGCGSRADSSWPTVALTDRSCAAAFGRMTSLQDNQDAHGTHPSISASEKSSLMKEARKAYRYQDIEASRQVPVSLPLRETWREGAQARGRLVTQDSARSEARGQGARRDARRGRRLRQGHDLWWTRRHPYQLRHRRGRSRWDPPVMTSWVERGGRDLTGLTWACDFVW
jgi:hypothetical protein